MSDTLTPEPTLYVTDAEMIRRLGIPEKLARALIQEFDRNPGKTGFPQKVRLFGNRRYWPRVRDYMDAYNRSPNGGTR